MHDHEAWIGRVNKQRLFAQSNSEQARIFSFSDSGLLIQRTHAVEQSQYLFLGISIADVCIKQVGLQPSLTGLVPTLSSPLLRRASHDIMHVSQKIPARLDL